jgi:hypothetical protein
MAATPPKAELAAGIEDCTVVPLPSSPCSFLPQQLTVPAVSRAHVWKAPAARATAPLKPETGTGVEDRFVVPLPS